MLDTNSDPDGITFPIPGNDDAGRAIALYCDLVARAALDGIGRGQGASGADLGAMEEPAAEELPSANGATPAEEPDVPTEQFELLSAPRGAPDDLAKLHGAGPQLVKKLNDAGIYHYWQVGAMTDADASKLDADLKLNGRIARDGWIAAARQLAST